MTNRLRPRLQPSSAGLLAPATSKQKSKSIHALPRPTGGTALLLLTERHRRRGWSQLRNKGKLRISCHVSPRNPAHGSSLGHCDPASSSQSLTCARGNDFTGAASVYQEASFPARRARQRVRISDRIATSWQAA